MRAHGYPDWPDPIEVDGRVANWIPTGVDTDSPQFLAAEKTCGV